MLFTQVSPVSRTAPASTKHRTEPNYCTRPGRPRTNTNTKNHGRVSGRRNPLCRRTDYGSSEYTPRLNIVLARLEFVLAFSFPLTSQCARQLVHTVPHDATRWCVVRVVTDIMSLLNGSLHVLGGEFSCWEGSRTRKHEEYHLLLREDTFLLCK